MELKNDDAQGRFTSVADVKWQKCREQFARGGYVVIKRLIEQSTAEDLWRYVCHQANSGILSTTESMVPGTPWAYADVRMERLLQALRPSIEGVTGLALYETYSYYRLYKHDDVLRRHTDRSSCEISVSLNLGQEPAVPWPLGIEGREGTNYVELVAGDAVVYRGLECPHWRDAYQGEHVAQVFLHYVDIEGPHRCFKYDRRKAL